MDQGVGKKKVGKALIQIAFLPHEELTSHLNISNLDQYI